MTGQSHTIIGVCTVYLLQNTILPPESLSVAGTTIGAATVSTACLFVGALGAIAPDIDHASSAATSRVWGRGLVNKTLGAAFRSLFGGHRALTHSVFALGALLLAWLGLAAGQIAGLQAWHHLLLAFGAAYATHIAADMLTKDGVKLFFPVNDRDYGFGPKVMRFKTGSILEYLATLAYVLTCAGAYFIFTARAL